MSVSLAMELIFSAKEKGGGTFNRRGEEVEYKSGYVVGGKYPTLTFTEGGSIITQTELVSQWIDHHPHRTYGSWLNEGLIHIDAVDIEDDLEYALYLARERGEKAIYDLSEGMEIFVR